MSSLPERVHRLIQKEQLVPDGGRVLVALSGGSDSVALTLLLHGLSEDAGFTLAGVVHVNHQLRDAAIQDEQFCRELAERLSLPIEVAEVDVQDVARRLGISTEEAGHRERYAVFDAVAERLVIDRVATAHTRDDQAETYLMRLIRGAGPEGLAGIRPRSGRVVRPVLEISRAELRAYLADREESFREDETNQDLTVTRNQVRHELLPFLQERFSPSIVDVLARTAAIARGDAEWLDREVNQIVSTVVSYKEDRAVVDVARLVALPVALSRRVVRRALEHVADRALGFDQIERFLTFASDPRRTSREADFPGCRVEWSGDHLVVAPPLVRCSEGTPSESRGFEYQLEIPGRVSVPEAGVEISAESLARTEYVGPLTARGEVATIAAEGLTTPLVVRSWHPGDVMRPLGLGGRKKLQDLFVDHKVARKERHAVPIVADKKKGIVWVVGHTVDEDFRVTARSKGMLILRVHALGGAG